MAFLCASVLSSCGEAPGSTEFSPELVVGEPDLVLGTPGDSAVFFGLIADLALGPGGDLFVLDRGEGRIVHFDSDGRPLGSFGGKGEGPGQFGDPIAMAMVAEDELVVLDQARLLLVRIGLEGSALRYLGQSRLSFAPADLCGLGGRVILLGTFEGHALHVLDSSGGIERHLYRFPETVDPDLSERSQENLKEILGLGSLACVEPDQVVFLPSWDPTVRAFSLEGDELWTLPIEDHTRLQWPEGEGGRLHFGVDEAIGWAHEGVSVQPIGSGMILAQFRRYGPKGGGRDDPPTEVRLFRSSDSAQVVFPDTLPVIAAMRDGYAWGWRNLPFPQVMRMPFAVRERPDSGAGRP